MLEKEKRICFCLYFNFKPYFSIFQMRYANKFDWFLLITGAILSVIGGAISPLGSVIFRGLSNTLMGAQHDYETTGMDYDQFRSDILFYVTMYLLIGTATFLVGYLATACFTVLCERQLDVIRKRFLFTVIHQDIAWFDNNEVGKLTQRMSR